MKLFAWQPNNVGHEGFLGWFNKVGGEIGNVHIAPLEREYHSHEGLNDKRGEVRVVRCKHYLPLEENGGQDGPNRA